MQIYVIQDERKSISGVDVERWMVDKLESQNIDKAANVDGVRIKRLSK